MGLAVGLLLALIVHVIGFWVLVLGCRVSDLGSWVQGLSFDGRLQLFGARVLCTMGGGGGPSQIYPTAQLYLFEAPRVDLAL